MDFIFVNFHLSNYFAILITNSISRPHYFLKKTNQMIRIFVKFRQTDKKL